MEERVLALREDHSAWGGRKIRSCLLKEGVEEVPSASTITEILRRKGRLSQDHPSSQGPWQRFESACPNALWQMDFKGHFAVGRERCHPLTVLDDHSRYAVGLQSCGNEKRETVQDCLIAIFRCYGLPERILTDNGTPWGSHGNGGFTQLEVWLLEQGIQVIHGRPFHPQTQGKQERFHRTLKAEVLAGREFRSLRECQGAFDEWRCVYNLQRPHEALGMQPPVSRYEESPRTYSETGLSIEYDEGEIVRKVDIEGNIYYRGRSYKVGKAFRRRRIALRPTHEDGVFSVHYGHLQVAVVDSRKPAEQD
jgi:transposase InsO family protein